MDLLLKRYNSPFEYLDMVIKANRFSNFVAEFISMINKESEEKTEWEFFLHKVWEGSFKDFKDDTENNRKNQNMSNKDIGTTINHSMHILENYKPC